jgi:hypothetical protein
MAITPYALQVQSAQLPDIQNMLLRRQQMQAAEQQQQVNALAMQKAQRDMEESAAFKNALLKGYDTEEGRNAMMQASPNRALKFFQSQLEAEAARTAKALNDEKLAKARDDYFKGQAARIKNPQQAQSYLEALYADPVLGPRMSKLGPLEEAIGDIPTDPTQFQQFTETLALGPVALDLAVKQRNAQALQDSSQNAAMGRTQFTTAQQNARDIVKNAYYLDSVSGLQVRNPAVSDQQLATAQQVLDQAGATLGEAVPGQTPSMVPPPPVPEMTGTKMPLVPGQQGAPAKTPLPAGQTPAATPLVQGRALTQGEVPAARAAARQSAQQAKINAELISQEPTVRAGLKSTSDLTNSTVRQINSIRDNPDLEDVTGNIEGLFKTFMGLTDQGNADVNATIKGLKSKAWLKSIQSFAAGSGLSPITDAEGQKLEEAYASLEQSQSTEQFKKNLDAFLSQLRSSQAAVVNAYNRQYGNLGIEGWQPMSITGKFPEAAIAKLQKSPTAEMKSLFNEKYGDGTADYFLKGAK